jgi:hypothetical protein
LHKQIRFNPRVHGWLEAKADLIGYDSVISVVRWTPRKERRYYTDNRFTISVVRKTNHQKKRIIIRVEETETKLVVLLIHAEDF